MRANPRRLIDELVQDMRHAVRALRRTPAFAATVVVTLALGVGANAAMFGVVDRLLFRPYPFLRDPGTVHRLYFRAERRGATVVRWDTEYTRYLDLTRWTSSFAQHAAFTHRTLAVGTGEFARERRVAAVSASFFDFFATGPALGRWFTAAEDMTPRGADVVVLGHEFWHAAFGGRDVRGEVLQVGDIRATIIGVAPRGFVGVDDAAPPAVYVPITTFAASQAGRANTYYRTYQWRWMEVMVRRRPGVSVAAASADATEAYLRSWGLERERDPSLPPADVARPRAEVAAMKLGAGPAPALEARTAVWVAGVAAVVLLIAVANVGNLLLTRALARRREVALRLALGVGRWRLVRHALAESVVLAIAAGIVGLLVAQWGGAVLRRLLVTDGGEGTAAATSGVLGDLRTTVVALGSAILVGVLAGVATAMVAARGDLAAALRPGVRAGTATHSRTRGALLVAQGALSVALLVGAGLFVRSLVHAMSLPLGYDADPVLLARVTLRGTAVDDRGRAALGSELLAAAQAIPGVEHAAWVSTAPLWTTNSTRLWVAGIDSVERLGQFTYQTASPDYFRTMGTRIERGRAFTDADRAGAPRVAVVSRSMARALWPQGEALGQCMRVFADTMPCATVVGVAEDIVQQELTASSRLHYYLPIAQYWPGGGTALLVRVRGDAAAQQEAMRAALQRAMPGQSYVTVRPMRAIVDDARRAWRLGATLFVALGGLALVVAGVGLYGVVGHDVAQRRHELGVRVALGARARDILQLVLGRSARLAGAGVALGATIALGASRWLQPLLFQQSATDMRVYAAVGAVMLAAAMVASASPAAQAVRADPNEALRGE